MALPIEAKISSNFPVSIHSGLKIALPIPTARAPQDKNWIADIKFNPPVGKMSKYGIGPLISLIKVGDISVAGKSLTIR